MTDGEGTRRENQGGTFKPATFSWGEEELKRGKRPFKAHIQSPLVNHASEESRLR